MPLVTISLSKSWPPEDQKLIADGIHEAIVGVGFPLLLCEMFTSLAKASLTGARPISRGQILFNWGRQSCKSCLKKEIQDRIQSTPGVLW